MTVFAHLDDESLGTGGTLAKYSAEGVETYVVCATCGERGWNDQPEAYPGLAGLGQIREAELRAATNHLGVRETICLDYIDGDLDQANPAEAIAKIVDEVRRVRAQVVITFAPMGGKRSVGIRLTESITLFRDSQPTETGLGSSHE